MSDEVKTADDAPVEGAVEGAAEEALEEEVEAEPVVIPEYHFVVFVTGIAHTGSWSDWQCVSVCLKNVVYMLGSSVSIL